MQILLQIDTVKKNLRAMELIRRILGNMRKYSVYYGIGRVKGGRVWNIMKKSSRRHQTI